MKQPIKGKKNMTSKDYKNYSDEVQKSMKTIESYLTEQYGELKTEWCILLQMLASELDIFYQCRDNIKTNGVLVQNNYSKYAANPAVTMKTNAIVQITKILQELLITPKSIKNIQKDITAEKNKEELIKTLLL